MKLLFVAICFLLSLSVAYGLVPSSDITIPDDINIPAGTNNPIGYYLQGTGTVNCNTGSFWISSATLFTEASFLPTFVYAQYTTDVEAGTFALKATDAEVPTFAEGNSDTFAASTDDARFVSARIDHSGGGNTGFVGSSLIVFKVEKSTPVTVACAPPAVNSSVYTFEGKIFVYFYGPPVLPELLLPPVGNVIRHFYYLEGTQSYSCDAANVWQKVTLVANLYAFEGGPQVGTTASLQGSNSPQRWTTSYPDVSLADGTVFTSQTYHPEDLPWVTYKVSRTSGDGPLNVPVTYAGFYNTIGGVPVNISCTQGDTIAIAVASELWFYAAETAYPHPTYLELDTLAHENVEITGSLWAVGHFTWKCGILAEGGIGWVEVGPTADLFLKYGVNGEGDLLRGHLTTLDNNNVKWQLQDPGDGDAPSVTAATDDQFKDVPQAWEGNVFLRTYSVVSNHDGLGVLTGDITFVQQLETVGGLPPSNDPVCLVEGYSTFDSPYSARYFFFESSSSLVTFQLFLLVVVVFIGLLF